MSENEQRERAGRGAGPLNRALWQGMKGIEYGWADPS
jgi:hypothetical protein